MPDTHFRSIAQTLNARIWRWATACALLITLGQTIVSWREVDARFENELLDIQETNIPLLSVSVWDIEPKVIQWQLDNLTERHSLGFVRLTVESGQIFVAGNASLAQSKVLRTFDVPAPDRGTRIIGHLEVMENPGVFFRAWMQRVGVAVLAYGILTLMICVLVAYVLRRELEWPLRHIARFAAELTPDRLSTPLTVERPKHRHQDEIDLVVTGFQTLQQGLNRHVANLDERVRERTRELEEAMLSIQRLSQVDSLTGCVNRRHFNERILAEAERVGRYERKLSVLFCDIDHFKQINDTLGHLAGDEVLRAVGRIFLMQVRDDVDWVARYGGEEFVVVLPETGQAEAMATGERLREILASTPVELAQCPIPVTISIGVAELRAGESVNELLARADTALYAAKAAGRNRVLMARG